MRQSPRVRRLRSDLKALERLKAESAIIDFETWGDPPEGYSITFQGRGFWRPPGTIDVLIQDRHEVTIGFGASYPRMMPELRWQTPIFHPNISASGSVCIGGYGTHWAPSVNLDELCHMLWDMLRYKNFDIESPYNRDAAHWAKTQRQYSLPVDMRPLRDITAGYANFTNTDNGDESQSEDSPEVLFVNDLVEAEIVEAEHVKSSFEDDSPEILFID